MEFKLKASKQEIPASIGGRVRYVRALHDDSISEMAEKIGVTPPTIRSWERGRTAPNIDYVSRIALAYNVSTAFLIGNIDYYKPLGGRFKLYSNN